MDNRIKRNPQRNNIGGNNKSENELNIIKKYIKNASSELPCPDDSDDFRRINHNNRNNMLRAASDSYSRNTIKSIP